MYDGRTSNLILNVQFFNHKLSHIIVILQLVY